MARTVDEERLDEGEDAFVEDHLFPDARVATTTPTKNATPTARKASTCWVAGSRLRGGRNSGRKGIQGPSTLISISTISPWPEFPA